MGSTREKVVRGNSRLNKKKFEPQEYLVITREVTRDKRSSNDQHNYIQMACTVAPPDVVGVYQDFLMPCRKV